MDEHVLVATERSVVGKQVKALRRQGKLPGIVYGAGLKSMPIVLDAHEASKVLEHTSASTLISLKLGGKTHRVLVREVQRDVIRHDILHVDLLNVAMDVAIRADIPIELVGEAPAVKGAGGVLVTGLSMIEVEALPSDLLERISVDLSQLKGIDDEVIVSDLDLGEKIRILTEPDELIARVIYQAEEIPEEEEEEVPVAAEPELIERGKREEEEEKEAAEGG